MRRSQALLARAERKAQDARLAVVTAEAWRVAGRQRTVEFWVAECARLREELLACVGPPQPATSGVSRSSAGSAA